MSSSARMQDGLYYFDEKGFQSKQVQSFVGSVSFFSVYEKIMLWHHRLGHPSFSISNIYFLVCLEKLIAIYCTVNLVLCLKVIGCRIK